MIDTGGDTVRQRGMGFLRNRQIGDGNAGGRFHRHFHRAHVQFLSWKQRGLHNPLSAVETHRLPGREKEGELDWEVTSSGGEERFLIVASTQPLAAVERAVATFRPSREGAETEYAPLDGDALSSLRGVGRVVRRQAASSAPPGRLAALEREWTKAAPSKVWTRLVVLRNP